ncbi:MAG TPA: D-hexose-6-phosphate mutarotase [Tepidisphaeraceae bacterium]|nr:D-hexose-6-phosphate mutarotase [Tepidisphaeraceae bacterium]
MTIQALQERFGVPGVTFKEGRGGLPLIAIENAAAVAEIYLLGATLTHFQRRGHEPVIFVSSEALFQEGKAIRGGVPICWPWFGPKWDDPKAGQHGLVRNKPWQMTSAIVVDSKTTRLRLDSQAGGLSVGLEVEVGLNLKLSLQTKNGSDAPARIEDALHTYLCVGDSRQVSIDGLAGATYIDKVAGGERKQQPSEAIRFTGETDRVYLHSESVCKLTDPVMRRCITVSKHGSRSTIIWNPWVDKSKSLVDFGDEEWQKMCCIETANAADNHLMLSPGQTHATVAEIACDTVETA